MNDLIDRARDLYPTVDRLAAAGGDDPLGDELVAALREAGLFEVMIPADLGGREVPIVDCIDIWTEVARADGSAGWCLMASCATAAYFGAWCPDELTDVMFGDGVPVAAGQFAPNGTARPVDGGYVLDGRYQFGSGVNHAEWIGAGVLTEVPEGDDPGYRFAIFPADRARTIGNWDVLGLRSTASYDYAVEGVQVPAAATFDFFAPRRHRGGPMYDLGVMVLTAAGHAGFALGVVRRALDELISIARDKQRMGHPSKLAESERFLHELGDLESRYRAGRTWVRSAFAAAEAHVVAHGAADPRLANECRQATVYITQHGADVVREAYLLAGTTALRAGPLQRCFRDIHAGTQHVFAGPMGTADFARDLLAAD